jgi:hypothetical protein
MIGRIVWPGIEGEATGGELKRREPESSRYRPCAISPALNVLLPARIGRGRALGLSYAENEK